MPAFDIRAIAKHNPSAARYHFLVEQYRVLLYSSRIT
jgi:hypothetical protein